MKRKKKRAPPKFGIQSKGGAARWKNVSKEERSQIMRENALKMWAKIKNNNKKTNA